MRSEKRARLGLVLLSTLSCFLLAEAGSRVLIASRTPAGMVFRKDIIYEYEPHSTVDGITMNDAGCIGDDVLTPRVPNEVRLLLLGGSTSYSQFYVDQMRSVLAERHPALRIKVTSCGRPRYTSYVNAVNLKRLAPRIRPDVAVIYLGINDNIYNTFPWLTDLPTVGFFNWTAKDRSLFVELFRYYVIDKTLRSTPDFTKIRSGEIFERNLSEMVEYCKSNGIKVVLATFAVSYPTDDEALRRHLQAEEPKMEHFWGKLDATVRGVNLHNAAIMSEGQRLNVPVAPVADLIPKDGRHFIDLCHLTTPGYEIMAKALSDAVDVTLSHAGSPIR
jgi:lysophospholipase L1-like esterase